MKAIQIILLLLFTCKSFRSNSQEMHAISRVEKLENKLLGMPLKKAIRLLDLDTNFMVISEPPGKYRGIQSFEIDGWKVQLYVHQTIGSRRIRKKGIYPVLKSKRVIGLSWTSENKCNSIGEFIPHYSYNRFGPCVE